MALVESAFGLLLKVAGGPAIDAAKRHELVIRALKKLRLDPETPPSDFRSLYAYTVVEALYGKPDSVLVFFRDKYVRQAFERSFSTDDWSLRGVDVSRPRTQRRATVCTDPQRGSDHRPPNRCPAAPAQLE